uniref:Defensin-like protein 158 family n=1 Tax=Cajanus cajan TaxID=3821 RepID=A0A151R8G5_CAJCA|nr:Putative defensin-like protein 158 family [Cajanus cajan]
MAKLSFAQIIFTLILFVLVFSRASKTDQLKKCEKVIEPRSCNLMKCQKTCYTLYRNFRGFGKCLGRNGSYECVCIYDCFNNKFGDKLARGLM